MDKPRHIAFIMDGNGRWAKKRGLERTAGHRAGTENIRSIIRHSKDLGIEAVTFYAFSSENFSRPEKEVGFLMKLIGEYFNSEIKELHKEGARITILGDLSQFSLPIQMILKSAMSLTKNNSDILVNIALGYGGRQEILRAVNLALKEGKKSITAEEFESYLYTAGMPDPDLIIRTSGEQRLSNYLIYQSSYSELYFTETLWPDFDIKCYDQAIEAYQHRNRRFGGLDDED